MSLLALRAGVAYFLSPLLCLGHRFPAVYSRLLLISATQTAWRFCDNGRAVCDTAIRSDILVQCLLNHGVEVVFAYPGGASMPIHQALTRVSDRAAHHPAAARAGRRLRGRGLRPHHRQGRRLHRHQRARAPPTSSPASPTPRWIPMPIIAITGQVGTAGHRHRRLPGNADRRGLPGHHQASLPGHAHRGHCRAS